MQLIAYAYKPNNKTTTFHNTSPLATHANVKRELGTGQQQPSGPHPRSTQPTTPTYKGVFFRFFSSFLAQSAWASKHPWPGQ
jgi:hypothetical protein